MAKATIAVAVLALALLLTGPVSAAQTGGRRLLAAAASSSTVAGGSGSLVDSKTVDKSAAFSSPLASGSIAGGAGASVSLTPSGQASVSTAIGEGTSLSFNGHSTSQASGSSTNNGVPGTFAGNTIFVGSNNGGASSSAMESVLSKGK